MIPLGKSLPCKREDLFGFQNPHYKGKQNWHAEVRASLVATGQLTYLNQQPPDQ